MSPELIRQFVAENETELDFSGGVGEEVIAGIEADLDVVLPESYRWFLRTYGYGGLFGVEILGAGLNGVGDSAKPRVVYETQRERKFGLPPRFVVIVQTGEYCYALDTSLNAEGDCPVDVCFRNRRSETEHSRRRVADGFYAYFYTELVEAKENWGD